MSWWTQKRYRMIQNNLRDIDACMDVDRYVEYLKEFGANVCMVGCGGITAFHPTRLECQKTSPYLRDDFFGKLLARCHENQIRVIARFDFSKAHSQFLNTHPEWFSRTALGDPVLFHDTAATCVNGPYQQELSLEILKEVISQYPVDGVFFNMFGYQTYDYSGRYVGICQCESCKRRFLEYSGMELPAGEEETDPAFRRYKEFKRDTTTGLLNKIYRKVKQWNPEAAVCTYSHKGVDLVRNESNSAVDRPLPFWMMTSEDNVSCVKGTYSDRFSSNCVINAVDIFYRFMGVSPYLNELRLYGAMAAGGNLDWCIIGDFETYPDGQNFEGTRKVFSFHEKYERYLNCLASCADILLVNPMEGKRAGTEYRGIFKMLKEAHLLFDVLDGRETKILEERAGDYRVIILPGVETLPEGTVRKLSESPAMIIGTGIALQNHPPALGELFCLRLKEDVVPVRGSYMLTEPKEIFRSFEKRDWVYLDQEFRLMEPEKENKNYVPFISSARYGPPERCFGHVVTDQSCITVREGKAVYFPWMPGTLYYSQGYEDFKNMFLDILESQAPLRKKVEVEAPPCIEVFFDRCGEGQYLLQLLNYSGYNGTTFHAPLPVEVEVKFPGMEIERIQALELKGKQKTGGAWGARIHLRESYKALLITGKEKEDE